MDAMRRLFAHLLRRLRQYRPVRMCSVMGCKSIALQGASTCGYHFSMRGTR